MSLFPRGFLLALIATGCNQFFPRGEELPAAVTVNPVLDVPFDVAPPTPPAHPMVGKQTITLESPTGFFPHATGALLFQFEGNESDDTDDTGPNRHAPFDTLLALQPMVDVKMLPGPTTKTFFDQQLSLLSTWLSPLSDLIMASFPAVFEQLHTNAQLVNILLGVLALIESCKLAFYTLRFYVRLIKSLITGQAMPLSPLAARAKKISELEAAVARKTTECRWLRDQETQHSDRYSMLTKKASERKAEITELSDDVCHKDWVIKQEGQKTRQLRDEVEALQQKHEADLDAVNRAHASKVATLQKQHKISQGQLDHLIRTLTLKLADSQHDEAAADKRVTVLEAEKRAALKSTTLLGEAVAKDKAARVKVQADLAAEKNILAQMLRDCEGQLADAQSDVCMSTADSEHLKLELKDCEGERDDAQKVVTEQAARLEAVRKSVGVLFAQLSPAGSQSAEYLEE